MASHFVSLNRGQEGGLYSDYATGAATTGGDIELRCDDAKNLRRVDVIKALEAFERFVNNPQLWSPAGFIFSGG